MVNYTLEQKQVLDQMLLDHPLVRSGKMFGYPAYYVGKKLCICLYEIGVGVKLPEASAARLLAEDAHVVPFQPRGKGKMREWIQINLEDAAEYQRYAGVFEESIRYVHELQTR